MSDAVDRVESLLRERISVIERQVEDIEIDYRSAHTKLKEALEKKIGNIQSEIHEFFDNQKEHVDNQLQSRLGPLRERQERLESELTAVHSLSNQV
jgi:chromosome segregation ATPase